MEEQYRKEFKNIMEQFCDLYMRVEGHSKGEMIKSIVNVALDNTYLEKFLSEQGKEDLKLEIKEMESLKKIAKEGFPSELEVLLKVLLDKSYKII